MDLCGYGKCSLGVAIPVLSAAGCDVCPVPTGLFSSHTAFPGWYMHDTTSILADYLEAWRGIGVEIDAVYSGFLGAPEQVDIIRSIYERYPSALRVVDPVMADHGKVYPTYTPELEQAMAELACDADILTPNLTEAALLTDTPYRETPDEVFLHTLLEKMMTFGAKGVVITGIGWDEHTIGYIGAERETGVFSYKAERIPRQLHGTGDMFCAVMLGALTKGEPLRKAASLAANFVEQVVLATPVPTPFGANFEQVLPILMK